MVVTVSTAVAVTMDNKTAIAAGRSCPWAVRPGSCEPESRTRHK